MKTYKLTQLLNESNVDDGMFDFLTNPNSQFTDNHKNTFLKYVKDYSKLSTSIYREITLEEITKKISVLGKIAEQVIMMESDDWSDKITLKRDVKVLTESVKLFENTAKEMNALQYRLESLYEDIGLKLSKYFEIDEEIK